MASTIDGLALGITTTGDELVSFSLSSPSSATLELGYRIIAEDQDCNESAFSSGWKYTEVFEHALETIRTHPLLNNIKRLRIWDKHHLVNPRELMSMAREAAGLLEFVGPLEELVLDIDDLRLFLAPFLDLPESQVSMEYSPLPSIKGLISPSGWRIPSTKNVGCYRRVRAVTVHTGCTLRACGFPHEVSSCGDGGVAGAMGSAVDFSEETISGDNKGVM